jgi:hypothetical protein
VDPAGRDQEPASSPARLPAADKGEAMDDKWKNAPSADEPARFQLFMSVPLERHGHVETPCPYSYVDDCIAESGHTGVPKFVAAVSDGAGIVLVFSVWMVRY